MRLPTVTAILATALAGTGCYVADTCDTTDLAVDWTFQDINGVPGRSCFDVGVAYVDVYLDGVRVVDAAPCTDGGVTLFNVRSGRRHVTVEGLNASLVILNRDQFNLDMSGCRARRELAQPGEGLLSLDYFFTPTNSCVANYMWYSLTDLVSGEVISAVDLGSPFETSYTCGPSVQFAVPLGDYRLDWMQAVSFSSGLGRYVAMDQICSPTRFSVLSGGTTGVDVPLAEATVDCGVGARP